MAVQSVSPSPTGDTAAAEIRRQFDQVLASISQARSTITAFKLAAEKDRYEKPELYWPDLMAVLHQILPDETDVSDRVGELFRELESRSGGPTEPALQA